MLWIRNIKVFSITTRVKKKIKPNTKAWVWVVLNVVESVKLLNLVNSLKNTPNNSPNIR